MKPFKEKFKRIETKYILTKDQLEACQKTFQIYLEANEYADATISNIYYDTPSYQMIRRSLEKPDYKEKLRVRSYQEQSAMQDQVFIEVKKKFQKVVYKRRLATSLSQAQAFLDRGEAVVLDNQQVQAEIKWLQSRYPDLAPRMYIYYERYAMQAKADENLRITLDSNLLYRDTDLDLTCGKYGLPLLAPDCVIMEIKAAGAYPLWLTHLLDSLHIQKSSFSKYGTAYKLVKKEGGILYA